MKEESNIKPDTHANSIFFIWEVFLKRVNKCNTEANIKKYIATPIFLFTVKISFLWVKIKDEIMNTFFNQPNLSFPGNYIYNPAVIFTDGSMNNFNEKKGKIAPTSNDKTRKTITIILADDDEDDRDLFKEAMEINAPEVKLQFAEDGKCLLDILDKSKDVPDLIFLDLNMPHKSGMECLAEIRKDKRFKDIPVIIYSTSSSMKDINDTFDKGANLYVKKPNSFNELQQITNKVLSLDWNKYKPHSSRMQFLFSSKTE